jgi:pilus assembly protein CpaC
MIRNSQLPGTRRGFAARRWKELAAAAAMTLGSGFLAAQTAEDLRLTVGKSVVIDYPSDVRQISTSNPEVVDASPITTREILLNAKGTGTSTMVVWSKTGQRTFYNVNVEMNLDPLRRILKENFPKENIEPHSSRDTVTLTGLVSSKEVVERASAMAAAISKTVVNNLEVATVTPVEKQILLRVKFAQLDREKQLQYGVNLLAAPGNNPIGANTGQFSPPTFNGVLTIPPMASGGSTTSSGSSSAGLGGSSSGGTSVSTTGNSGTFQISQVLNIFALDPRLNLGAFIKALEGESILQVLAEPNLVTSNGKEANFLVGGEFPVPILQGGANSGAVTVQFREFGIRLRFTPQITPNNTIKLDLRQEVSTLDFADGTNFNGFTIPALSTRKAETNVELGEGQSFIVAGLVNNQESSALSKVPIIGNIPILGALFKSKDDKVQRTELIMMVTPEITMPLGPGETQPNIYMPKDFLVRLDPKDVAKETSPKSGAKTAKKR